VCGGIAEYFNVDATVVRLGVVIATIATGIVPGTLVYLVAMVIVPEAPPS
jgi:phage shock protein C